MTTPTLFPPAAGPIPAPAPLGEAPAFAAGESATSEHGRGAPAPVLTSGGAWCDAAADLAHLETAGC